MPTPITIQGYSGTIGTSFTTLWDEATAYTFLAANMSSPTISSASANDTAAGTGARTVQIWGVDVDNVSQTEVLTLNGQTGVALVNSYKTINLMRVLTAGSGGVNAGIVYVGTGALTSGKPAVVHGLIKASRNQSTSAIYCVPDNAHLFIGHIQAHGRSTTAGGHELEIKAIPSGGLLYTPYVFQFQNTAPLNLPLKPEIPFAPGTQIRVDCLAGAGTGPASVVLHGHLVIN